MNQKRILDYQSPGAPGSAPRWWPVLILVAALMIPLSIWLTARSLVWDYRGARIYAEMERKQLTLLGMFSGPGLSFQARETSRHGWRLGQYACAVSSAALFLCAWAIVSYRRRTKQWPPRWALSAAAIHLVLGVGIIGYWVLTGIPQPWVD